MKHLMTLFTFSSRLYFLLGLPNFGSQVSGLKGDEERARGGGGGRGKSLFVVMMT